MTGLAKAVEVLGGVIESQEQIIAALQAENEALVAERDTLRSALREPPRPRGDAPAP